MTLSLNVSRKNSEIKKEEDSEKIASNIGEHRQNIFFGSKEEKALDKLISEFESLSKENYENFY